MAYTLGFLEEARLGPGTVVKIAEGAPLSRTGIDDSKALNTFRATIGGTTVTNVTALAGGVYKIKDDRVAVLPLDDVDIEDTKTRALYTRKGYSTPLFLKKGAIVALLLPAERGSTPRLTVTPEAPREVATIPSPPVEPPPPEYEFVTAGTKYKPVLYAGLVIVGGLLLFFVAKKKGLF